MTDQEIHVRHLTGIDPRSTGNPPSLKDQCRVALDRGAQALARDGYRLQDVTRIIFMMRDTDGFPSCFPLLRDAFGTGRPGTTLRLVPGFDDPDTQIEIELVVGPSHF
ncbi:hypothetical protein GLI01_22700 [Gluconacetobacter liquefaciens]|uniref:Enamine deaminase RidA (YjgF/YER057c/UK114 family) n=1 Tax=Gluconacetobacter liquefaciens TaxID=89584 RepID=A0A370GE98_GLULI|nr:hypothetical protein [Gluconacetobacter liquefaciens]MBB2184889.1 hypothetical protein [Gluconacetobacter liquefaciens]RDI40313.1 enamine deaminase RidA (YjgF/YER057c/UK114 family) [Gluconacetobacter liquefaciens]GBR04299.1 translation initiation inhibitor YjgF [Gluconacetobacter liquefaciens NRIC 0522]GEB38235.1 hypothetical protein GLI01_22700 [Gluconacetobacter liquefaciens]